MGKEDLINALLDELESSEEPQRYVYHFENEIDPENVQELIDRLTDYRAIDLFFTTLGGEAHAMRVLLHFINNHPDIKVYLTGYIASAGTFLLIECNKEIILCEDLDWVLFHLGDRTIEGSFRKTTLDYTILTEQLKEENNKWVSKYKELGLNPKEIKRILEGDDVVLYRKDFDRLKINNLNK
jgi:ATP-dependent protease ClpP protease subunit